MTTYLITRRMVTVAPQPVPGHEDDECVSVADAEQFVPALGPGDLTTDVATCVLAGGHGGDHWDKWDHVTWRRAS